MVRTCSMRKASQLTPKIPPSDVITEILYRLPAKSIGRFRCVSKDWLTLLTDPQFIKTHTKNTLKQHHLIFKSQYEYKFGDYNKSLFNLYSHPFHEIVVTTPTKLSLELECGPSIEDIMFSSSCDGLVLVCVNYDESPLTLLLVNPTTNEKLELPEDYYSEFLDELEDYFEDINSNILYGFGYDSVTDDYKVVTVIYFNCYSSDKEDLDKVEGVYVYDYSIKSKTWRRVTQIDSPYYNCSSEGVFVNGIIYWIVSKPRPRNDLLSIVAFCLGDETFSEIPFPKSRNLTYIYSCQLVVLAGKLAIFLQDKGEIWLMNEFEVRESWTKISLHGINKIPLFKQKERYRKEPLVIDGNDKILVANNDRMMVYEVEKGTFSETVCVWNPKNLSVFGTYVESLVSLKHNVTKQKSTSSKHIRVDSYWGSTDIPESSSRDLLDPETGRHLAHEDLGISNDANIQSKFVEIQALVEKNEELLKKSRALDTANAEIESLKAKLAKADQERRKAIATLQSW